MEILAGLVLLIGLILVIKKMPKKRVEKEGKLQLKELVKNTFPKYKIIEKHQTIMICEIDHRNEPDELVFIRISPNQRKNIKKSGRMLICDYPQNPTAKEMLSDFRGHL